MREIKFRAWHKRRKLMLVVDKILNFVNLEVSCWIFDYNTKNEEIEIFGKNLILMQYTGLKDKKGKEIYEGDKVIVTTVNASKYKGFVVFDRGSFCIKIEEENDGNYDIGQIPELNNFDAIEVIGNIYEV